MCANKKDCSDNLHNQTIRHDKEEIKFFTIRPQCNFVSKENPPRIQEFTNCLGKWLKKNFDGPCVQREKRVKKDQENVWNRKNS